MKIDVFAHVLLPQFYKKMLALDPALPQKMPFLQNPILQDMEKRQALQDPAVKQLISFVNVNPEDYLEAEPALALVQEANQELLETVRTYPDQLGHELGQRSCPATGRVGCLSPVSLRSCRHPFLRPTVGLRTKSATSALPMSFRDSTSARRRPSAARREPHT